MPLSRKKSYKDKKIGNKRNLARMREREREVERDRESAKKTNINAKQTRFQLP